MALFSKTSAIINKLTASVCSMGSMICKDELKVEVKIDLIHTMIELENLTDEFVSDFELMDISNQCVTVSKREFIRTNKRVIAHIEKLQEQGYKLGKVKQSLQLEVETLEKKLFYMS